MIDRTDAHSPNTPPSNARPLQSRRILLAEDSADAQRLIAFMLHQEGAIVEVAENGRIAIDRVAETTGNGLGEAFDVIVMDMHMPVMDGYEATAELRRQGFTAPIVALTAQVNPGDREKCLAAGCDDYLAKRVDRIQLIDSLVRALDPSLSQSGSVI